MSLNVTNPRRDLRRYGFTAGEAARITELAGGESLERIENAARAPDLNPDARRLLDLVARTIRGVDERGDQEVLGGGARKLCDLYFTRLEKIHDPGGEYDELRTLRADMQNAIVGHEHTNALEACVAGYRDFLSKQRQSPAFVALASLPGHGLDELVDGYAQAAFGKAPALDVDLAKVGSAAFADDGDLGIAKLRQIAVSGGGVVHVRCPSPLDAASADKLASLLNADRLRNQNQFAHVIYVLSFPGGPDADARQLAIDNLGSVANRRLSGAATLGLLDAHAMAEYARAYIDRFFTDVDVLKPHNVTFDDRALVALGELLATPHEPLFELDARVEHLVLKRFNERNVKNPDGALFALTLASLYKDPDVFAEVKRALHAKDPRFADFNDVFQLSEVAKLARPDDRRIELRARTHALTAELTSTLDGMRAALEGLKAEDKAQLQLDGAPRALLDTMQIVCAEVDVAVGGSTARFLDAERHAELARAVADTSDIIDKLLHQDRVDDPTLQLTALAAQDVVTRIKDLGADIAKLDEPADAKKKGRK